LQPNEWQVLGVPTTPLNGENGAHSVHGSTREVEPLWSDLRSLGKFKGILNIDTEITDRVLNLGVAK
jgi:hypothetical protein